MTKFLFLLSLLLLVPVAARAEESTSTEIQEPQITEPMAVTIAMPIEPEMKYISSEPVSLESSPLAPAEPSLALSTVTEPSAGGLLIPEMTIGEPSITAEPIAPSEDSFQASASNE